MTNKVFNIRERSLEFAICIAKFVDCLPFKQSAVEFSKQLLRSSASIGANLEEADGALSKKDFLNKIGISRREAKETHYWLRLLNGANLINEQKKNEFFILLKEAEELKLILSSIINKTKGEV